MDTNTQNDNLNEDWIKTLSWDLGFTRLSGLLSYLGEDRADLASQRQAVSHFMELLAWQAAPEPLRREVSQFMQGA